MTYQIAVGLGGALAEIADSGYELRESGTMEDLLAVWAERESLSVPFVAVGRHGTILVSDGPGEPWESPTVKDGLDADLRGVAYALYPHDFGFAAGDSGTVMVGTSRGLLWQRVDTPTTQRLNGVAIDGEGRATVVGDHGTILRTPDRGASWEVVASPSTEDLLSILVSSRISDPTASKLQYVHSGYIVGTSGTLLHSPDGVSWVKVETGVADDLRQVLSHVETDYDPEVPLVLGDTRLYTWKPGEPQLRVKSELHRSISSVAQYLSRIVVLVDNGEMLRYNEPYLCERTRD